MGWQWTVYGVALYLAALVMLGALVKITDIIKIDTIYKSIEMMMGSKKKLAESSVKAVQAGYDGFPFT